MLTLLMAGAGLTQDDLSRDIVDAVKVSDVVADAGDETAIADGAGEADMVAVTGDETFQPHDGVEPVEATLDATLTEGEMPDGAYIDWPTYPSEADCGGCVADDGPLMMPVSVTLPMAGQALDRTSLPVLMREKGNVCTDPLTYAAWLCAWQGFERA